MGWIRKARENLRRHRRPDDFESAVRFKREFFWKVFKALDFNGISGDYVEFGCHGGTTFRLAFDEIDHRETHRHLWAFDSFRGLPPTDEPADRHPWWRPGTMATQLAEFRQLCRRHGIPSTAYSTVEGFYEETLAERSESSEPRDIALAYVDCDLYSSTRTVLEFLEPRLKPGMVLAFDDYFCWTEDGASGERRALNEFVASQDRWSLMRYRDYGWAGTSFVVEARSNGASRPGSTTRHPRGRDREFLSDRWTGRRRAR